MPLRRKRRPYRVNTEDPVNSLQAKLIGNTLIITATMEYQSMHNCHGMVVISFIAICNRYNNDDPDMKGDTMIITQRAEWLNLGLG